MKLTAETMTTVAVYHDGEDDIDDHPDEGTCTRQLMPMMLMIMILEVEMLMMVLMAMNEDNVS